MNIGLKIRELRKKRGFTQERLAEYLNISSQAVSKWENGNGMPDITLLPKISILFGITIDELFEINDETHIQRIDKMIENTNDISDNDFAYAEQFLTVHMRMPEIHTKLAKLYNLRAAMYHKKAENHVKKAIEAAPGNVENYSLLCEATNGVVWDWNIVNHHSLIEYYYELIRKHPTTTIIYIWLIENLIADMRLDEAEKMLSNLESIDKSIHIYRFKGNIALKRGDIDNAEAIYSEMINVFSDSWQALSYFADFYANLGQYNKALELYKKAASLQASPRLIDNYLCIAHISEIEQNNISAISAYEQIIDILIKEHKLSSDSDVIMAYQDKINTLKIM